MNELEGKLVEEGAKKAFSFLDDLIKPPLREVGEVLADKVKYWRFKNQVNILLKTKKFLKSKGIKSNKVPVKTLAKLLEYASFEEDETMQDKWVGLLTSAAGSEGDKDIYYILVEVLNQLSPLDVRLLDLLYSESEKKDNKLRKDFIGFRKHKLFKSIGIEENIGDIIIENLNRMNLVEYKLTGGGGTGIASLIIGVGKTDRIFFTKLGIALVEKCRVISIE